jgi:hypothetical protein
VTLENRDSGAPRERGKYKRSKIPLADRGPQLQLSATIVLYLLIYTILLVAFIALPSILTFTQQDLPIEAQLQASRDFLAFDRQVVPAILVVMGAIFIHFIFITHRIFGPIVRLKQVLRAWGGGTWPTASRSRDRDYHQELFQVLKDVADKIGGDLNSVRQLLDESLAEMARSADGGISEESVASLNAAEEKCRKALAVLGKYDFDTGSGSAESREG